MQPAEIFGHLRKRRALSNAEIRFARDLEGLGTSTEWTPQCTPFILPQPADAPEALVHDLKSEAARVLRGEWKAFGWLPLKVSLPPRWDRDCLAGIDLPTRLPARQLNHRSLPAGADIKLVWELSRWMPLVALAQTAFLTGDVSYLQTCFDWLDHWAANNPPFVGWNWTSALESGLRLLQFTWIDELSEACIRRLPAREQASLAARLQSIRGQILPPHVWFTWRARSFGSSANNHLLGELAGLIAAIVRWPELSKLASEVGELRILMAAELEAQFAPDGGNREQALNYQLFSWEFGWHASLALRQANIPLPPSTDELLQRAVGFFVEVWRPGGWDYGDSDSAFAVPTCNPSESVPKQWHAWFSGITTGSAVNYWWNPGALASGVPWFWLERVHQRPHRVQEKKLADWRWWPNSGIAIRQAKGWFARWDLSPLGYLETAAHGHLDALHLSLWANGNAAVIDPGTGAYYGDKRVRVHLASWRAHNGPIAFDEASPRRLGPFLWAKQHPPPECRVLEDGSSLQSAITLSRSRSIRTIRFDQEAIRVLDQCVSQDGRSSPFHVHWQFPPGAALSRAGDLEFLIRLPENTSVMRITLSPGWVSVRVIEPLLGVLTHPYEGPLDGLCSPAFRYLTHGPALHLTGTMNKTQPLETMFRLQAP